MRNTSGRFPGEPEVTAIIPVFNDREALDTAIIRLVETLDAITGQFELIIAEDGSTDGSDEVARRFALADYRVRLLHNKKRLGRGKALARAIREARGPVVCYFDVDLATDLRGLAPLIGAIQSGSDLATGSRLMPSSAVVRTPGREQASRTYNALVQSILGSRISDHQCGFKAFNRARILPLLPLIRAGHWFWDTELLVRAQRAGLRCREIPVNWRSGPGTTVRPVDVLSMGASIIALWWTLNVRRE